MGRIDMRKYSFSKSNERICKLSFILFFLLGITSAVIIPFSVHGYVLLMFILFPPLIYIMLRQSTGFLSYDNDGFEIINSVWFGTKFKADWPTLDHLNVNSNIDNIILGFGKIGYTSFGDKSPEFKRFIIDMLRVAAKKNDIKNLNESVQELIMFDNNKIDDIIESTKPNLTYEVLIPLIYTLFVIAGMLGIVILMIKFIYQIPYFKNYNRISAPIIIFVAFGISSKVVGFIWKYSLNKISFKKSNNNDSPHEKEEEN